MFKIFNYIIIIIKSKNSCFMSIFVNFITFNFYIKYYIIFLYKKQIAIFLM